MECGVGGEGEVRQRWRERERGVGGPRGKGGWVVDRERRVNLSHEGREKRTGPKGSKPRKIQRGSADSIGGKRTRGPVIGSRLLARPDTRSVLRYRVELRAILLRRRRRECFRSALRRPRLRPRPRPPARTTARTTTRCSRG